jgi:hypothetical protein
MYNPIYKISLKELCKMRRIEFTDHLLSTQEKQLLQKKLLKDGKIEKKHTKTLVISQ